MNIGNLPVQVEDDASPTAYAIHSGDASSLSVFINTETYIWALGNTKNKSANTQFGTVVHGTCFQKTTYTRPLV
jgi:hypothetical protein